ncbi:hypothetical protein EI94DRAFT_1014802 [Lactarius quietus]|nr:hypothetical protein EI94DRAFT_1014802 [Lactarius quietus]
MNITLPAHHILAQMTGNPSDASRGSLLSSNPLPSSGSPSSGALDPTTLHASEATPEIEPWRSSISNPIIDDSRSHYAESVDSPDSESRSRATRRLQSHTDHHRAMRHAYTPGQGVYRIHSGSLLSLTYYTASESKNSRVTSLNVVSGFLLFPWTVLDIITTLIYATQDEPPAPLPPLSASTRPSPIITSTPVA